MLACPSCSQPNPDGAVYCLRCGAGLPRPGATLPGKPLGTALGPVEALPPPAPAPAPAPVHAGVRGLRPGMVVDGKYELESVLGEGGMGIVYLARDINTDTRVVVKAIRAEMAHEPELRERILAEGRALAHIDHPNVVRLNAVVLESDALYLVMQFVDGQSLDKMVAGFVATRRPFPIDQALDIFRQAAAGVGAAHREGVVHRDIKPANVLMRAKDGVAKVTDFGIAKLEEDAKAGRGKTQGIIGSLWYMAPEQVTGRRDLDKRVDIYGLGIMLYELLVGQVPFDAPGDVAVMKMHVEMPLPSVCAQRPDVPAAIDRVLARACAKRREDRFSSCDELIAALDAARAVPATAPMAPLEPSLPALAEPPPRSMAEGNTTATPQHDEAAARFSMPPASALPRSTSVSAGPPSAPPPPPLTPRRWPLALAGVAVLGGAAGLYVALSGDEHHQHGPGRPRPTSSADAAPADASAPGSAHAPVAPPLTDGRVKLSDIEGSWWSDTGRAYDAVMSGDTLEFRIVDPAGFPGQNYNAKEARFTLLTAAGRNAFLVEDKIRPVPPPETTYDPISRNTCQEVWRQVGGRDLEATFDGERLTVELVKITPPRSVFDVRGTKVVGCRPLLTVPAAKIVSTLTRTAPPQPLDPARQLARRGTHAR
jgi:eukaryotic-like serine/threonine-protein kinase